MNVRLGDHHDRKMDGNLDGNLCLHMSDRVDDHLKDGKKSHRVDLSIDPECYVLVDHHKNVTDDRNDLKMVVNHVSRNYVLPDQKMDAMTDGNLCRRMNDLLGDHSMDDDHHDALVGLRRNVMDDQNDRNLVAKMDVSRDLRRNDQLDDQNLDVTMDVSLGLHMNDLPGGHLMDGNRVNRNYVRRDLMMVVTMDVKNLHVMLMVYLSKSCDRMSRDHLRYDRQMMRHRDTNRTDGKNPDVMLKIHHVSWC
jgi:hypothetical protein